MASSARLFRYLALGDSYTIGEAVPADANFPAQLLARLRAARGVGDPALTSLQIIATTGWTTRNLLDAIATQAPARDGFDLVTLLIGVNNQYQGKPLAEYQAQFQELLDLAVAFAGDPERVIVVSIPDYAFTPFVAPEARDKVTRELDEFNAANLALTQRTHPAITYVNITPISRQGLAQPELVATDRLHPSALMYSQWVDLLLPHALRIYDQTFADLEYASL